MPGNDDNDNYDDDDDDNYDDDHLYCQGHSGARRRYLCDVVWSQIFSPVIIIIINYYYYLFLFKVVYTAGLINCSSSQNWINIKCIKNIK